MDEPKPHYQKLKHFILRHITNGDWPARSRVPSENELTAKFGLSRMTVNRALRELTGAGVLTRVQGVGTFVAGPKAESAMFEVRNIREEIQSRGQTHSVQVLICETVEAKIRSLGAQPAFPVNTSLNEIAAHYTAEPNDQTIVKEGDVL